MLSHLLVLGLSLLLAQTRHLPRRHRFQHVRSRNLECHCVVQDLCPDDDIAVNGHGLLDPRNGDKICPNIDELCCSAPTNPKEDYDEPDSDKAKEIDNSIDLIQKCGYNSVKNLQSRILGSSSTTRFGELPWNLIVQEYVGEHRRHLYKCGASLIHPKVAITAAHCVASFPDTPEKIIVRAGEWDINSRDEPLPYQDATAEEILVHSDYNPLSLKHDIAIIILSQPFVLADNVGLMCLAPGESESAIDTECTASGWGKDAHERGKYSSVLKKIQMPIVPREVCTDILRTTRLGRSYILHESFLCAGGERNKDACKGDGGSPLICPLLGDENRYVQVGIVAWGIGCGAEGIPGVYVNVALYLDWIDSELGGRDLDTSLYRI